MNRTAPQTNDTTNNTAVAAASTSVPLQQAQSSQSFDPLMNVTPNAAAAQQQNKAIQMSPEQMQKPWPTNSCECSSKSSYMQMALCNKTNKNWSSYCSELYHTFIIPVGRNWGSGGVAGI
jgi:hypothetical protein